MEHPGAGMDGCALQGPGRAGEQRREGTKPRVERRDVCVQVEAEQQARRAAMEEAEARRAEARREWMEQLQRDAVAGGDVMSFGHGCYGACNS